MQYRYVHISSVSIYFSTTISTGVTNTSTMQSEQHVEPFVSVGMVANLPSARFTDPVTDADLLEKINGAIPKATRKCGWSILGRDGPIITKALAQNFLQSLMFQKLNCMLLLIDS